MKRFLLSFVGIIAVLFAVNAETYTHTFKDGELATTKGKVTLTGYEWDASDANNIGWDGLKGIQFGNKNEVCESYTLTTDAFKNYTIKSITVHSSIASSGDAKLTIKAGESKQETFKLTTTSTAYTLDCNTKGNIEISWNAGSRAYFVRQIEVVYALPAEMVDVEEATFKTPIGIYADMIYRVTVETKDKNTVLYYTTDGTEPNYEDYIAEKEGCTTATSRTYAMDFDGKNALKTTTTIKVLAVKTDGDAVYKSDIVEATYIVSPTKPYIPATEISEGKRYAFIANDSIADALHTDIDNGYLESRKIAKKEKYIESIKYDAFIFTAVDGGYTIQDAAERYMFANNDNTFGFAEKKPETGAVWNITISDNKATIKNGERTIYYSKENDQFGCYTAKSEDLELPALYMLFEYSTATITPAKDNEIKELQEITITCEDGIDFAEGTVLETSVSHTDNVNKVTIFTCTKVDDKTLKFTSDKPVSTSDNVELYINLKGTIYLNPSIINMKMPVGIGNFKNAIAMYELVGDAPAATIESINPTDNSEVEYLSNIIFTFSNIVNNIDSTKKAKLYLEGSSKLIPVDFKSSIEGVSMEFEQAALVPEPAIYTNGTYILEVPDGYFLDRNGREVKGTTLKIIVKNEFPESVEDIIVEGEKSWIVYNIAGVKVLETENAEQLNILERGIYIINGKKRIIE